MATEHSIFLIEAQTKGVKQAIAQLDALIKKMHAAPKLKMQLGADNATRAAMSRLGQAATKSHRSITQLSQATKQATQQFQQLGQQAERAGQKIARLGGKKPGPAPPTAVSAQMKSMEGAVSRFSSRVAFLMTAMVAQFATDIVLRAANDFEALAGQIRGMEIAATRAGVAGKSMFKELTDSADAFNFKAAAAADTLNKLLIGGIETTAAQVRKAKETALGAAVMFGEDPSKMMNDLATAALRTSRRIADNLGIVVRANEVYEKFAATTNRTANELTAGEKAMAFWNAMLDSAGAVALRAAAQLETPFLVMEKGKVTLYNLALEFGRVISSGLIPFVKMINSLSAGQMATIASTTLFIAKIAALAIAAKIAVAVIRALNAAMLVTAARFAAIAVPIGAAILAVQNYQKRMADLAAIELNMAQAQMQLQGFLETIGITLETTSVALSEAEERMEAFAGSGEHVTKALREVVESVVSFRDSMVGAAEETGATKEELEAMEAASVEVSAATDELIGMVADATSGNEDYAEASKLIAEIANGTVVPAIDNLMVAYAELQAAQAEALIAGASGWDRFVNSIIIRIKGAMDAISALWKYMAQFSQAIGGYLFAGAMKVRGWSGPPGVGRAGGGKKEHPGFLEQFDLISGAIDLTDIQQVAKAQQLAGDKTLLGKHYQAIYDKLVNLQVATRNREAARNRLITGKALDDVPDKGGVGGGGKGGGKGRADLYAKAEEKLLKELALLDTTLKYLGEYNEVEREKLLASRDTKLLNFMIEADTNDWLDRLGENVELSEQISKAYDRYKGAIEDGLTREALKQIAKAKENVTQMQRENELRRMLGLEVDDTKLHQKALSEALKLASDHGLDIGTAMSRIPGAVQGWKAALDELAADARQHATDARLSYDLEQMDYQSRLDMAREPDPNYSAVIGANAIWSEIQRQLQAVPNITPASEEAWEMQRKLQNLNVELANATASMAEFAKASGKEVIEATAAAVDKQLEEAFAALDVEGYVTELEKLATEAEIAAGKLDMVSTAGDSAAAGMNAAASAAYGLANALAAAAANAAANAGGGGDGGAPARKEPPTTADPQAANYAEAASPGTTAPAEGGGGPGYDTTGPHWFDPVEAYKAEQAAAAGGAMKFNVLPNMYPDTSGGAPVAGTGAGGGPPYDPKDFDPSGSGAAGGGGGGAADSQKAEEKKKEKTYDVIEALARLAEQALSSSNRIKELGENLVRAGGQMLAQMAQQMIGGPLGTLAGGLIQFGINMRMHRDTELPVTDDPVDVRVINWDEAYIDYAAVRDTSELAYSKRYREAWAAAARG